MRKATLKLAFLLVIFCFTTISAAVAQDATCAPLVEQALNTVEDGCAAAGRNEACYGYVDLTATAREGASGFNFTQAGDLANVADVQSIRLSALNVEANTWGIALMRLQANLPDTLPGQNVTFLLFGDVEIENAVETGEALATIDVTSGGGINVRTGPSTNYAVAGSLATGETVIANGRNADSSWLRIQIPDSDSLGWVSAPLVTTEGDIESLSVVEAGDEEVPFTPMQAFYFTTSITGTNCEDAPADGILIQTPEGVGSINLRANDVDIQLGSTAFLQAQPSDEMIVSVIEGQGEVSADGVSVTVPAGSQVTIPMTEDLQPAGAPSEPMPYEAEALQTLPVEVLPREIEIAEPISEEDLAAADDGGDAPDFSGGLPGMGGDVGDFGDIDLAWFCPYFDSVLADAGMTRGEYLDLLGQVMGFIPAEDQADIQEFITLLQSCP